MYSARATGRRAKQSSRSDMDRVYELFPDYARDLKINLQNVLKQPELTEQQTWGTAVASAVASRNPHLMGAVLEKAIQHLSPEAMGAAKSAAAIMGMNNIYYRFQHLSGNARYSEIPARLRMQAIRSHATDPLDFELWCIAVSTNNNNKTNETTHENV